MKPFWRIVLICIVYRESARLPQPINLSRSATMWPVARREETIALLQWWYRPPSVLFTLFLVCFCVSSSPSQWPGAERETWRGRADKQHRIIYVITIHCCAVKVPIWGLWNVSLFFTSFRIFFFGGGGRPKKLITHFHCPNLSNLACCWCISPLSAAQTKVRINLFSCPENKNASARIPHPGSLSRDVTSIMAAVLGRRRKASWNCKTAPGRLAHNPMKNWGVISNLLSTFFSRARTAFRTAAREASAREKRKIERGGLKLCVQFATTQPVSSSLL